MIKVLLIDDEKLALEYLENIIDWEYYGFKLVGSTMDVEQALSIYRKNQPVLIISDIKMPGMSGIELAQIIRENDNKAHILFMSGYRDFNYIKQAIRLGIDDYLLKSDINEEILLNKILKLKNEIEKEHSRNQYTTGLILKELFEKSLEEENYKDILDESEYIKIYKKYYYLILTKKTVPRFIDEYIPPEKHLYDLGEYDLNRICKDCSSKEGIHVVSFFSVGTDEYLAVLEMEGRLISQREINNRLYQFSLRIFNSINNNASQPFCIYYYSKGCSARQFGSLFDVNKSQLLRRYVIEQPQIVEFSVEIIYGNDKDNSKEVSISADEIYHTIKSAITDKSNKYIQIMKIAIEQENYYTYLWYLRNIMEAMSRFEVSLIGEKSKQQFFLAEGSTEYNFLNPNQIVEFIKYKLEQINIMLNEHTKSTYSKIILEALDFIQKSYMVPELSTNHVANHVNLSNSWLSTKFKDEVGVGMSDYINSLRIKKAKQVLDEEEYMIYEVAEKVGFTSSQYFSKIFKQFAGITPNEYKRNNNNLKK